MGKRRSFADWFLGFLIFFPLFIPVAAVVKTYEENQLFRLFLFALLFAVAGKLFPSTGRWLRERLGNFKAFVLGFFLFLLPFIAFFSLIATAILPDFLSEKLNQWRCTSLRKALLERKVSEVEDIVEKLTRGKEPYCCCNLLKEIGENCSVEALELLSRSGYLKRLRWGEEEILMEGIKEGLSRNRDRCVEALKVAVRGGVSPDAGYILHRAVVEGDAELVELLLSLGADPEEQDNSLWSAVGYAKTLQDREVQKKIMELLKGARR